MEGVGATASPAAADVRARLLAFTLLATVFDGAELVLLSYFFPRLAASFHVSLEALVTVNTLQGLMSLAGGLLFGPIGDRFGRRTTMLATVFVYGAATVAGAFAHAFLPFAATRILAGLGIGGEFGAAFAIFNELWPTEGRGVLGAFVQNMFVVGIVCTTAVGYLFGHGAAAHAAAAWRPAYLAIGGATLAVWLGILAWMPESPLWAQYRGLRARGELPPALRVSGSIPALFGRDLWTRTTLGCLVATGVFFLNYSLLLYEPTLLVRAGHLSPGEVTAVLLLGYLILFVASLVGGVLSDGWGRRRATGLLAAVGVVGYVLYLLTWRHPFPGALWRWGLLWSALVINFGNGAIGLLGVWWGELYPTRLRATAENFLYYVGRGLGASLLPWVAIRLTHGAVGPALGLGLFGAALAAAASLFVPETLGRRVQAVE
jgi:MFS family permease